MKVLHLNAGNETGGGMVHILSLLKQIKSENIYLGLFEEGVFQQKALENGIQTVTFTQKSRYDFSILSRITEFIQKNNINIIHTHGARANLYGYFLKKKTNATWMTTIHSDPRNDFLGRGVKGAVFTKLNISVIKRADYLFAISDRFKEMLIEFQIKPEKITTIYNGIDFGEKRVYNLEMLRNNWNLERDDFVIAMVARFDPVKRHALAFASLKEVVEANPDLHIKLLLVGDGTIRSDLERAVKEHDLAKNILFLGYQQDVARFYQLADVTLLTSKTESFPLVLLESARECTPAITTDVGGVDQMIPGVEYGFIVDVDNKKQITAALQAAIVLKRENQLKYMGRNFYEYTSKNFSIQLFVESITQVYQKASKACPKQQI